MSSLPCTVTLMLQLLILQQFHILINYDVRVGNNPALVCDAQYAKLANGNPSPTNQVVSTSLTLPGTGYPTLSGINLLNNADLYCGLMVSYSDATPIKLTALLR
ncbi:MAG: hypothetical protein IPN46_12780 [Saprospiraceae bacterium]|nr:hypothetical protein [Saprospiraceae bacterium]